QFQVTVVENIKSSDLRMARWVFPAYLVLAGLFVVPISLAGQLSFGAAHSPDSYVINLPLMEGQPVLALLAFLGGASAATGMVIVAAIALSTMVSNDVVLPLLLRNQKQSERSYEEFRGWMLNLRRSAILIILLLAYVVYRLIGSAGSLANTGQIAFAAIAQLAPAMFGALFWKQANRTGVFAGLLVGISLWFYLLVLPLLLDGITLGSIIALSCNFAVFVLTSMISRTRVLEHWQASRFVGLDEDWDTGQSRAMLRVTVEDLLTLAARFIGEERAWNGF